MDYKHSGELEANGQGKASQRQKKKKKSDSVGNLEKKTRKEEENGCFLRNQMYRKTDFMLMRKGIVLKGPSSSLLNVEAHYQFPFSTISMKQKNTDSTFDEPKRHGIVNTQEVEQRPEAQSGHSQAVVSGAREVPSKVSNTLKGGESKSFVLNSGNRLHNAVSLSLPGPNFILRSR